MGSSISGRGNSHERCRCDQAASATAPCHRSTVAVLGLHQGSYLRLCVVQAYTERGGWGLAPIGILIAGLGGFFIRHVTRPSVTLGRDALIVTTTFKTHSRH